MNPLSACLIVAAFLFCVGLAGALARNSAILVLAGIELMLGAANLNFIAFWRYGAPASSSPGHGLTGVIFVLFSIGVAAAEAAVGLALILAMYRHAKTSDVTKITELKG
jgi:NADH-quinone oxidoreductase subunit K